MPLSTGGLALGAAVVCILLVAVWFRVERIDRVPGLNGDEAWSGMQAIKLLRGEPIAWRTPTGNLLNVLFVGPCVALHAFCPPSIGLLRTVSVVSGLLAIGLNYWLCRRTFDGATAIVSTVLLAVLPVTIAYSRFAWDASQTPQAAVLVVYLSLAANRSILAICAALVAAIVVHPTNLFMVPIAAALTMPVCPIRIRHSHILAGAALGTALIVLLRSPSELGDFLFHCLRLFSGSTVYQFISGGVPDDQLGMLDVMTFVAVTIALWGEASRIRQTADPRDVRLLIGTGAALVAFMVIAGPRGIQPHLERYALWCVIPVTLILSRGAAWWLQNIAARRMHLQGAMLCFAALLLAGFRISYFNVFERTGGESHLAFRTADVDPKQAALNAIQAEAAAMPGATIVSHNWWTRLPIEYLSAGQPNLRVVETLHAETRPGAVWFIELAGSDNERQLAKELAEQPMAHRRTVYSDRAGRAVVVVYSPQAIADDSLKNFARSQFDNGAN